MPSITFQPVNIVHVAFITLCLLGIALVVGEKRYKALVLLFSVCALQQFLNILEELNITRSYLLITPAIQLGIGPLYYLFVKNVLYGDIDIKKESRHLAPMLLGVAFTQWWPVVLAMAFVLFVIYFFFAFKLLTRYQRALQEFTATDEFAALAWIQKVFIAVCAIEAMDFIRLNLQLVLSYSVLVNWYFASACILFFTTAYLLVRAVRQPEVYAGLGEIEALEAKKNQLQKQALEKAEAQTIFSQIDQHVDKHLCFQKPKYSLRAMAEELGLNEQTVSWAINHGGQQSFSDFINGKRIHWIVNEMQQKKPALNILQTAYTAGFNSKSTFNAVFKRRMNCTPSQYLQSF